MMVSLLLLSVSSLFLLHLYSERRLISQLRDYTEDLSTAIEVFQEQPAAVEGGDLKATLDQFAQKLRQLGVKDVSIADTSDEVQASTDPRTSASASCARNKKKGPKEYVIRGVLGEENRGAGAKTSTLTVPIVIGERRIGTLLIQSTLEDFSALSQEAFLSRLLATLAVFALGIMLALYSVLVPDPAPPGTDGSGAEGRRRRPRRAGLAAGAARSAPWPAASTRWSSGCASIARWRSGCTSPSARARSDASPPRSRTRSGIP
jgi:hypothetical protein